MPTVRQERSVMYLRNTGEGRDVLRILTQVTDAPVRRVFRQLASSGCLAR